MTPEEIAKLPYRPCVGVMLANADGQVFVAQRKDRDTDAWQMPQGGVDKGEDMRAAALRELEEETSIAPALVTIEGETAGLIRYDIPHALVPNIWKGRYRGQEQKWYLMRFNGTDADIDLETEHPEFTTWKWMSPDDLVGRIVPFKRAVYEQVLAEFAPQL
ncbi:RNA pyrophosphohydrolase [Yoonia sp.]|uniref:RNA pyrophosphohydrolase n=1 Tax=Yoonia sp. TaxID=2212373 RepID=UPI0023B4D00A